MLPWKLSDRVAASDQHPWGAPPRQSLIELAAQVVGAEEGSLLVMNRTQDPAARDRLRNDGREPRVGGR